MTVGGRGCKIVQHTSSDVTALTGVGSFSQLGSPQRGGTFQEQTTTLSYVKQVSEYS